MRIIYFDLDCMRPDHFGCYGYHRNTTPNLDRIGHEGVRFTHAYCSDSPCVPSRAALFSGRFGIHNGAVTHWGLGSEFRYPGQGHFHNPQMPMLARHLRQHGYKTVSFSSFPDRHQAFWFTAGFSEMHTFTLKGGGESADEVNAAVIPWLENHGTEDNYFLHINYWDAHRNYTMPKEWADLFKDDPPPAWPDQSAIDAHQANYGPFSASELFPWRRRISPVETMPDAIRTVENWKKFVDGYDGAIRYMDYHIGQIFALLDMAGILDEVCFIVSCDHAEAMGEQGIYGDHVCASESVHNIPMIIRWPGITPKNREYSGFLYNVDLCPTLCELLDIPIPNGWDGQSFVQAVRGEDWQGRDHLIWGHALYSCQRAVRTERWLYMRTYHPGLFPFDPVILYDMQNDPHQTQNVFDKHPQVVMEMDHLMMEWYHQNLGQHGAEPDPMQLVVQTGPWKYVQLEPWIERLREKGRGKDADTILKRLGK